MLPIDAARAGAAIGALAPVIRAEGRGADGSISGKMAQNQIHEQVRLTIEIVKERQERELLNNKEYGLLNNVNDSMRIKTRWVHPPRMIWMT